MQLGEEWNLKYHVLKQLKEFTCLRTERGVFGGRPPCQTPAQDRGWGRETHFKSKIDQARLPHSHSVFKPHLQRLNHCVALYKLADESILEKSKPYDDGQGWIMTEDRVLEPVWSCGAALPKLIGWSLGHWWSRRRKTRMDEFEFDDFSESDGERWSTLIVWSPREVEARQQRKYHSGLLFPCISKWVGKWT